jgi:hypothetical protein
MHMHLRQRNLGAAEVLAGSDIRRERMFHVI